LRIAPLIARGTWTPTISAGSGTITTSSASGRYTKIWNLWWVRVDITITTNGTGAGGVVFTLPPGFTATEGGTLTGRETTTTFYLLRGAVASGGTTCSLTNYDATYPAADGYTFRVSGWLA
jgi:hypothetical protein